MNSKSEFPSKEVDAGVCGGDTYKHDAFGTISMTVVQSGGDGHAMFGSDLRHTQAIRITVQRAQLVRNLSYDRIDGKGSRGANSLVTFEMSHAQFAQFITGGSMGAQTPVTLCYAPAPGTPVIQMPGIKNIETKAEVFQREVKDSAKKQLAEIKAEIDRLGAMLASGKVGVKEAREIHRQLEISVSNLPGNMAFVVSQAEEALEKGQMAAKLEIEAYVKTHAHRLGMNDIQANGLLLDGSKEQADD